jgi:GNAT superfamily N-acetyltransferase
MNVETKDLTPQLWPDLERLFGSNGACGGCWCMAWRTERGERWADIKGAEAKRRMRALVRKDAAHGVLAYVDGEPVGWCAYGRRAEYAKLDRAQSLACNDAERVWSLPCFFIKRGWRGKGIATALLGAALELLRKRGAEIAEGYPVKPARDGAPTPAAFAWTGTRRLFDACGFEGVGNPDGGKQRVRRRLV